MYKYIKSGKITVLSRCSRKICSTRNHVKRSMQKGEATRVIYLHELLWLIALWLDVEVYAIDARVSDLCYNNFSSLAHEKIVVMK